MKQAGLDVTATDPQSSICLTLHISEDRSTV